MVGTTHSQTPTTAELGCEALLDPLRSPHLTSPGPEAGQSLAASCSGTRQHLQEGGQRTPLPSSTRPSTRWSVRRHAARRGDGGLLASSSQHPSRTPMVTLAGLRALGNSAAAPAVPHWRVTQTVSCPFCSDCCPKKENLAALWLSGEQTLWMEC